MEPTYLFVFGIIGWSLSLYFGFFRYKQYRWSRAKVHYDLFNKINQRSDAIFLKLSVLQSLPRKGEKGQAKFASLRHKYLEMISEKMLHVGTGQLPAPMIVFWLEGIHRELRSLHLRDPKFLTDVATTVQKDFNSLAEIFTVITRLVVQHETLGPGEIKLLQTRAKMHWISISSSH